MVVVHSRIVPSIEINLANLDEFPFETKRRDGIQAGLLSILTEVSCRVRFNTL